MVIIGDEILNGFTNEINMAVASKALSKCIQYNDISSNMYYCKSVLCINSIEKYIDFYDYFMPHFTTYKLCKIAFN